MSECPSVIFLLPPPMKLREFREFLQREADRSDSANEFARRAGVSHTIISKFTDPTVDDPGYPRVETIVGVAQAAGVDPVEVYRLLLFCLLNRPDLKFSVGNFLQ